MSVTHRIAMLLMLAVAHCTQAVARDRDVVIALPQSFEIGKGGRPLLLPVKIDGHNFPFLLDTGAAKTCFDISLGPELKDATGDSQLDIGLSSYDMTMHACPDASVGTFSLRTVKTVLCVDLSPIRYATGMDIYGILGADFLVGKCFEIDFDIGMVQFDDAEQSPPLAADAVELPISMQGGVPHIPVELPGGLREWVIADTGANQTTLRRQVFQALVESGHASNVSTHHSATLSGMHTSRTGTLKILQIGTHRIDRVVVDSDDLSLLGMDQLSRFRIRFDLRSNRIVLQPGAHFAKSPPSASSGMSIIQMDGAKVVIRTVEGGAARLAGVIPGDRILAVNNTSASQIDMFDLRQLLMGDPKKTVNLKIQRGRYSMQVDLQLKAFPVD